MSGGGHAAQKAAARRAKGRRAATGGESRPTRWSSRRVGGNRLPESESRSPPERREATRRRTGEGEAAKPAGGYDRGEAPKAAAAKPRSGEAKVDLRAAAVKRGIAEVRGIMTAWNHGEAERPERTRRVAFRVARALGKLKRVRAAFRPGEGSSDLKRQEFRTRQRTLKFRENRFHSYQD